MTAAPARMHAIRQESAGGPEVLRLVETDRPVPGPTEILVRVRAAGVNPVDWKTRARGFYYTGDTPPFGLGFDVSGVVEAVGDGVTLYAPGDEVYGMPRFPHPAGAYAEYVAAPARHFAPKPRGLDHVQAAGLPLAALTAWQAVVDTARVTEGRRVLIHAAAGGVGHLAVQIAKARGAYVIGTASAAKHDFLRGLGADELIDYREQDFAEELGDLDVVVESISGDYPARSLHTLRPGGTLVSLLPLTEPVLTEARERGIRAVRMMVEPDLAGLRGISELVESGQLRTEIAAVLPLAEAGKAHELGETGRTSGKIVLTVGD
ncbi:NADP-dependent oxidoreductase [Streptomyces telluris]|uniref:NADP-dependent oxidoreductase n=1 Tax=Streptomyces telluris TaxID=2720021 RepID=A0A9X2LCE3_9ACTN|nr:NADP-dependent oxidoreductase [Streptomyces telluris]MCQ8768610.1 NADP-dependent oxidoreductase [Streptomyces telluris]